MNIHDGHEFISIKILINKISLEIIELNNQYLLLNNEYNILLKDINNNKKHIVNQVNYLLEKQLENPTKENQLCISQLYKNINSLDNNVEKNNKFKKIKDLQEEINYKLSIISNLESKIPEEFIINKILIN